MATPSSKQNPGATPTYLTSSPRPSGGHMPRTMSHKSPSTRTPSASGHGHTHPPTSSSHLYATPLAVTAEPENPISFSSPSALLALGAYGGISPSPAVHDSLVGSGMHESDIQALGMQGLKLGNARDNDEERRRHIEQVVQLLWTRVAGRGVCREGVERLGQLEGFESIWQEDNLNIAGNFVDLEIEFYRGQNVVKDVSLKYATPGATDGERRDEATAVLKRDLSQTPAEGDSGYWKSLTGFHENLKWLARHDKLSQEVNCFEAVEGLYESLKRVWDEEGVHRKFSGAYEHLCSGFVGRPRLHKGGQIGLSLDYWIPQARVLDAKRRRSPDEMAIDQAPFPASDDEFRRLDGEWSLVIECEEGYPSLRVSKDWVGSEVLSTVEDSTNMSSSEATGLDNMSVNWVDPPATLGADNQGASDGMVLDSGMLAPASPNRRFVARMEPPLDLPILAASDIYRHLGMQMPQDFKMVTYDTYDGLLAPGWSVLSAAGSMGLSLDEPSQVGRKRSKISVQTIDQEGKNCTKQHSYTFQPFEPAAGRTVRDIPFSHPRQLADILPILRQYAFLANIIRKIFPSSSKRENGKNRSKLNPPQSGRSQRQLVKWGEQTNDGNMIILSNENPNEKRLNSLLGGFHQDHTASKNLETGGALDIFNAKDEVKVDVTLRTQLGQAPMIMLLFTLNETESELGSATEELAFGKISISFEVGLNGRITVVDVTGLVEGNDSGENTGLQDAHGWKSEAQELRNQIANVLEISHDIGILVEWVLRWARRRKGRG